MTIFSYFTEEEIIKVLSLLVVILFVLYIVLGLALEYVIK